MIKKFQEIEQFRNALRNVQHKAQFVKMGDDGEPIMNRLAILPKLKYESTVKIHGTCSSVRIEGKGIYKVTPQSRNNELTAEKDNAGFAKLIIGLPDEACEFLFKTFGTNIVVHGEFFGKGIQDTVAVSQIEKSWAIFRIEKISEDEHREWINFRNVDLTSLNQYRIYSIYQFGVEDLVIDFEHPAEDINKINAMTLAVEECCPVGKFFGIEGVGEGRVWSCVEDGWRNSKYVFKVKGEKHSKSKVKKLANVDIEKMKSIEDFVAKHANEERLMQAYNWLKEQGKEVTEKETGEFIRWVFNDILKEEKDELEGSGLTQKDLGGAVAKVAKNWYFAKLGN